MNVIVDLFGENKNLDALNMSLRATVVFIIAMIMIRVAGIKSFGKQAAYDNIIVILLGAILSRAIAGVSPFGPVIASALTISLMSRFISWLTANSDFIRTLARGRHRSLFKDGVINKPNLKRSLLSEHDLIENVRLKANTDSLEDVKEVFLECSGEVSVIKKPISDV